MSIRRTRTSSRLSIFETSRRCSNTPPLLSQLASRHPRTTSYDTQKWAGVMRKARQHLVGRTTWVKGGMIAKAYCSDLHRDKVEKKQRTPPLYSSHQLLGQDFTFSEYNLCIKLAHSFIRSSDSTSSTNPVEKLKDCGNGAYPLFWEKITSDHDRQ